MPRARANKKIPQVSPLWETLNHIDHVPTSWRNLTGHSTTAMSYTDINKNIDLLLADNSDITPSDLSFPNPDDFRAGGVNIHSEDRRVFWERILQASTRDQYNTCIRYLNEGATFEEFCTKGHNGSKLPPRSHVTRNHPMSKEAAQFAKESLAEELRNGTRILVGEMGKIPPTQLPHIIYPSGVVEQRNKVRKFDDMTKPNKWCTPQKFQLPHLGELTSWISKYASVIDAKSCYMNILIHPKSRKYFGTVGTLGESTSTFVFVATTLVFGWNCSPQIEMEIASAIQRYIVMIGIEFCIFYDDGCIGEIHKPGNNIKTTATQISDARRANTIVCLVFIGSGFFVSIQKSTFMPNDTVQYLGALVHFNERCFSIPKEKRDSYVSMIDFMVN